MHTDRKRAMSVPRVLVFYPFFPVYRKDILYALAANQDTHFEFAGGTSGRASISTLTSKDLPEMQQAPLKAFGPFTWNAGVLSLILGRRYESVIVSPALSSVTVWLALFARSLSRRPIYLWGQCGKPGARGLRRTLQELMNRLATGLLVYGESEREAASELGTPRSKVHVVYNAVRAQELTAEERWVPATKVDEQTNWPVVTYVGRITPEKRLDALVDAMAILRRSHPDASAVIVGAGSARAELEDRVRREGLPIELKGAIHDERALARVFRDATVIVSPYEIGLLAIDGLTHRRPVLFPNNPAKNGPEVEALTPGVNAASFAPADPTDIARAVADWLDRQTDLDPDIVFKASTLALKTWSASNVANRISSAIAQRPFEDLGKLTSPPSV